MMKPIGTVIVRRDGKQDIIMDVLSMTIDRNLCGSNRHEISVFGTNCVEDKNLLSRIKSWFLGVVK